MKGASRLVLLGMLQAGCIPMSLSANGGYTQGFGDHARDAVRLSGQMAILTQPQRSSGLALGPQTVIDDEAMCFYGFGAGVHGSLHQDLAMFGVGASWLGYCKANDVLRFSADVGIKVLELGHSGGWSAGFGSPVAEVGLPIRILDELFIEPYGTGGYDVWVGSQKPFGYAGGGLRIRASNMP